MNVKLNVVFIGGGNMADALIGGMLKNGFAPSQLRAVDVGGDARRKLSEKHGIACFDAPQKAARDGDIVVFAVKPQHVREAAKFSGLKPGANLVISIAAGITLAALGRCLSGGDEPAFGIFYVPLQTLFPLWCSGCAADDRIGEVLQSGHLLEADWWSPGFDSCAAPGRIHESDGNFEFLAQAAGHVVAAGGEVAGGFRRANLPCGIEAILGNCSGNERNFDVANPVVGRRGDFCGGISTDGNGPFHVGLAGTQPDFADEDILQHELVAGLHLESDRRIRSGLGRQGNFPAPGFTCLCHGLRPADEHGHLFTWVGGTPDPQRLFALEHHVVGEDIGEFYVGFQGCCWQGSYGGHCQKPCQRTVPVHQSFPVACRE